jgi:hypothetical protein
MVVADIRRRLLMFLSLIANTSPTANLRRGRKGIRNSLRDKVVGLLMGGDMRSRLGRHWEMGLETGWETGLQMSRDMGMGSRARRCVLHIRCVRRPRLGICQSGWRSTITCQWISRSACCGKSLALTG